MYLDTVAVPPPRRQSSLPKQPRQSRPPKLPRQSRPPRLPRQSRPPRQSGRSRQSRPPRHPRQCWRASPKPSSTSSRSVSPARSEKPVQLEHAEFIFHKANMSADTYVYMTAYMQSYIVGSEFVILTLNNGPTTTVPVPDSMKSCLGQLLCWLLEIVLCANQAVCQMFDWSNNFLSLTHQCHEFL